MKLISGYRPDVIDTLISTISGRKIAENLRSFTVLPHSAGSKANTKVAEKIAKLWKASGLEGT